MLVFQMTVAHISSVYQNINCIQQNMSRPVAGFFVNYKYKVLISRRFIMKYAWCCRPYLVDSFTKIGMQCQQSLHVGKSLKKNWRQLILFKKNFFHFRWVSVFSNQIPLFLFTAEISAQSWSQESHHSSIYTRTI